MTDKLTWGRYTELRPDALNAIRANTPIVYLPWGSLEWHGPHLPLGLDGLIAEKVAERLVQRTGGVLMPPTWWSIAAIPQGDTVSVDSQVIHKLWDDILASIGKLRWRIAVIVSGQYSQGHELVLMDAAEEVMCQSDLLVLALPPLALVDEEMLDHAAMWETSQILALRPDLVDLSALGDDPLTPGESAVIGRDPRGTASMSLGERIINLGVERIVGAVEQLLNDKSPARLYALYERRRSRYNSYVNRYCRNSTSVDQASADWWKDIANL